MYTLVICLVVAVISAPALGNRNTVGGYFNHVIDTDGDGKADLSDFEVSVHSYDTNNDGNVTLKEFAEALQVPEFYVEEEFDYFDANNNNGLDDFDVKAAFNMFDTDNDGQVTQYEFVFEYYQMLYKIYRF